MGTAKNSWIIRFREIKVRELVVLICTCFVDFRQAFDRVWHKGLFYKLAQLNNNYFYRTITDMYNKTKLSIKLHNKITDQFDSTIGVRQGDNLSPSLFNIFINDLPQYIRRMGGTDPVQLGNSKINCLMYADDVVLLSSSLSGLQKSLNGLKEFSDEWKMQINLSKTKMVVFNKSGKLIEDELSSINLENSLKMPSTLGKNESKM